MPLYDLRCSVCETEKEIFCCINDLEGCIIKSRCPQCGGKMKQVLTTRAVGSKLYPFINEHFDGTPIEVRSKGHYKELCKKFDVRARALL